jgi:hypothetical protein
MNLFFINEAFCTTTLLQAENLELVQLWEERWSGCKANPGVGSHHFDADRGRNSRGWSGKIVFSILPNRFTNSV